MPPGSIFFHFHAVFLGKSVKWYVGTPPLGFAPPLWEILDPPLLKIPIIQTVRLWYRHMMLLLLFII